MQLLQKMEEKRESGEGEGENKIGEQGQNGDAMKNMDWKGEETERERERA